VKAPSPREAWPASGSHLGVGNRNHEVGEKIGKDKKYQAPRPHILNVNPSICHPYHQTTMLGAPPLISAKCGWGPKRPRLLFSDCNGTRQVATRCGSLPKRTFGSSANLN